jgi:hypothetical protein
LECRLDFQFGVSCGALWHRSAPGGPSGLDDDDLGACPLSDAAYSENGRYSMLDLIVDITQVDSFRLRTAAD